MDMEIVTAMEMEFGYESRYMMEMVMIAMVMPLVKAMEVETW